MRQFVRLVLGAIVLSLLSLPSYATEPMSVPEYPETRREPIIDQLFGERVADPYRWLEQDVRASPQVSGWVARQNEVTRGYLDRLPGREWFSSKIETLLDFERFGIPRKAGKYYFYERNTGLLNQAQLFVRKGLKGKPRLLIDPNALSVDGTVALDAWKPSPDGRYLLYSLQSDGSDWRTLKVFDVRRGEPLDDEIEWAKFTDLAWIGHEGFLYSRFSEPEEGQDFQALNYNQAVYFHRIGTPQAQDELVFATPDHPKRGHFAEVTDDGRWAVITSTIGTDARYEIHVIDIAERAEEGWNARPLITGFDNAWNLVAGIGGALWFTTNEDAPHYRVVGINLDEPSPRWVEVVPEVEETIAGASLVGDRLILSYLKDAASRALLQKS